MMGINVAWDELPDLREILNDWLDEGFEVTGPRVALAERLLGSIDRHPDPRSGA